MTDLVWRKEPPDEEGWWWMDRRGLRRIVQILFGGSGQFYMVRGYDEWGCCERLCPIGAGNDDALWAGPIPLPKEAK